MMSLSPKSFGVKTMATPAARRAAASDSGMMPPTMTGTSPAPASRRPAEHLGDELHVRAAEDREPDEVHVLGDRGRDDLLGRQPDALVDDLEAGVAGAHGHLLGAVAVAVEARLADEDAQLLAELVTGAGDEVAHAREGVARLARADTRPSRRRRWERGTRRTARAAPPPTPPS